MGALDNTDVPVPTYAVKAESIVRSSCRGVPALVLPTRLTALFATQHAQASSYGSKRECHVSAEEVETAEELMARVIAHSTPVRAFSRAHRQCGSGVWWSAVARAAVGGSEGDEGASQIDRV